MPPPKRNSFLYLVFEDQVLYKTGYRLRLVFENLLCDFPTVAFQEIPDHILIEAFSDLGYKFGVQFV